MAMRRCREGGEMVWLLQEVLVCWFVCFEEHKGGTLLCIWINAQEFGFGGVHGCPVSKKNTPHKARAANSWHFTEKKN